MSPQCKIYDLRGSPLQLLFLILFLFSQIDWPRVFYALRRDDNRLRYYFGHRQKSVRQPESCLEFATEEVQGGISRGEYMCSVYASGVVVRPCALCPKRLTGS